MSTGKKFKDLLHSKGLTQQGLAKEVGIAYTTISKLANDKPVTYNTIGKICKHFNLPFNYFDDDYVPEVDSDLEKRLLSKENEILRKQVASLEGMLLELIRSKE